MSDMTTYDTAILAREQMHWLSVLISAAKKDSVHAETLPDIAEYLADAWYIQFDEMAKEA